MLGFLRIPTGPRRARAGARSDALAPAGITLMFAAVLSVGLVTVPSAPARADGERLSLSVSSVDGPVAGRYFQDLGRYRFSGELSGSADHARVEVYRRSGQAGWTRVARTDVTAGSYEVTLPVTALGAFTFVSTTGGSPGSGDELASDAVTVTVEDSTIVLDKPVASVDSLRNPTISGTVTPARDGVEVHVDVLRSGSFRLAATAVTNAAGRFSLSLGYGRGTLATYTTRATHRAANRDRWEVSSSERFSRIAVLNPVVTQTTSEEVASTYRPGCPVAPERLSTVTMNYFGRDKKMHRGLVIVRSDLSPAVIRGFDSALAHRFPVAKMKNPNAYGGNDPAQMKANNTSGFNCRKVVGNPYAQSPHSYGIAVDVSPVQNPYRDIHGTWWPSNGKSYIDRTPRRFGMLVKSSYLTRQLSADEFFWGGLWSPGRDYQHFEYRGPTPAGEEAVPASPDELPPPPAPTAPAPETVGRLTATALPVPEGWRPVALVGGHDEGFLGNGTWVHARDPRYAARDALAVGCAAVSRGDYVDPIGALEGNYRDAGGRPGVGLALDFPDAAAATRYVALYRGQVEACTHPGHDVRAAIVPSRRGLVDRRSSPDGRWTEVVTQRGARVSLVILSDDRQAVTPRSAQVLLDRMRAASR